MIRFLSLFLMSSVTLASPLFKGVPLAEWGSEVERAPASVASRADLGLRVIGVLQFSELMTLVNLIRSKLPDAPKEWVPESLSRGAAQFRVPTSMDVKSVLEKIQGLETPFGRVEVRADDVDRTIQVELEQTQLESVQ